MTTVTLPNTINFNTNPDVVDQYLQDFIVCCFFTPSYEGHAKQLKQSIKQLQINYYLQPVPEQGYWEANTRIKPYFLDHCLKQFPNRNVLYLDADAIVKNSLNYFDEITCDVAVYHTKGAQGMSHDYLTGTIFLKNKQVTKDFVGRWCAVQDDCKLTLVDQDSFDQAMQTSNTHLVIADLPLGYIKIFDKDFDGKVYIEQYQASRQQTKLKRKLIRRRNQILSFTFISLAVAAVIALVN